MDTDMVERWGIHLLKSVCSFRSHFCDWIIRLTCAELKLIAAIDEITILCVRVITNHFGVEEATK